MPRSPLLERTHNEGKAEGEARALLTVLASRGITLTAEMHERVSTCTDIDQLEVWLVRATTAGNADEVFDA